MQDFNSYDFLTKILTQTEYMPLARPVQYVNRFSYTFS